jgi:hypothetical protein
VKKITLLHLQQVGIRGQTTKEREKDRKVDRKVPNFFYILLTVHPEEIVDF